MKATEVTLDIEVVRSKGDYVVGRVGKIVAIDKVKNRAQVQWYNAPTTWVSFNAIEPTASPYTIVPGSYNPKTGRHSYPKYQRF